MSKTEVRASSWSLLHLLIALAWAMVRTDGYDALHLKACLYVSELRSRLTV